MQKSDFRFTPLRSACKRNDKGTINLVPRVFLLSNMAATGKREDPGDEVEGTIAEKCPASVCEIVNGDEPISYWLAYENIRFSTLFAAGDVSRGGTSTTQRQKFHTDDVKYVQNPVRSPDWSAE